MLRLIKKINNRKAGLVGLLFVVTFLALPHITHAGFLDIIPSVGDLIDEVAAQWVNLTLHLNALILGLAGMLFDVVVKYTIVDMSSNLPTVINVVWGTFRDLANMFFIFILLYIAIGTILGLSSVNTKKMLVHLIIVALLINFSLFFTKVIIDVSNTVTIGFYNGVHTVRGGEDIGIAQSMMNSMGISSIYNASSLAAKGFVAIIINGFMGGILMLTTAVVLIAVDIIFIARFVILIFLMILAPLAYVAYIVPTMQKHSQEWWHTLFAQCIFAPAFMALLWASLKIFSSFTPQPGSSYDIAAQTEGLAASPALLQLIMNFVIVIALVVGSLIISKKIGVAGASTALAFGKSTRQWGQGFVGRAAVRTTGVAKLDKTFRESAIGQTFVGRGLRNITTGALTEAKFGSKDSVRSSDKTETDLNKKYASEKYRDMVDDLNDLGKPGNIKEQRAKKADEAKKKLDDFKKTDDYMFAQNNRDTDTETAKRVRAQEAELQNKLNKAESRRNDISMANTEEEREYLTPIMQAKVAENRKSIFVKPPIKQIRRKYLALEKNANERMTELLQDKIRHKQSTADEIAEKLKEYETGGAAGPTAGPATPPTPPPVPNNPRP